MGGYTYLAVVDPHEGYDRLKSLSDNPGCQIKGYGIPTQLLWGGNIGEGVNAVERYDPTDDYEVRYRYDVEKLRKNAPGAAGAYAPKGAKADSEEMEMARQKIALFIDEAEKLRDEYGDQAVIVVNL